MEIEQEYLIFGRFLKQSRKKKGYSQVDLAEESGMNRASIANIEAGHQRIMLKDAIRLARLLDFSLDEMKETIVKNQLKAQLDKQPNIIKTMLKEILNNSKGGENEG